MNSALLIIDMQKGFLDNQICYPSINSTLEYINAAVELFNETRKPIFTIQDEDAKEEPGPKSYELIDSLKKEMINHHKISKIYSNAFWETSLEKDLKSQNINFLVLAGFAAEGCVNYTYNGARERFHRCFIKKWDNQLSGKIYTIYSRDLRYNIIFYIEFFIVK